MDKWPTVLPSKDQTRASMETVQDIILQYVAYVHENPKASPAQESDPAIQVAVGMRRLPKGGVPLDPAREGYVQQVSAIGVTQAALERGTFWPMSADPLDEVSHPEVEFNEKEQCEWLIREAIGRAFDADTHLLFKRKPEVRGDFEHAHEDVRRVECAVQSGLPAYLMDIYGHHRPSRNYIRRLNRSASTKIDFEAPTVWLGFGPPPDVLENVRPSLEQLSLARGYWRMEAFHRHAKRAVVYTESIQHAAYGLRAMARMGHREAFLKAARLKVGTWRIPFSDRSRTIDGIWDDIIQYVGPHVLRIPDFGNEYGWLVQEYCPMVDEMRVFVVDNRIVAAVPVRRDDSVYSSVRQPGRRIEPRSTRTPSGSPSREDRAGPAKRVRFARHVITDLKEEIPTLMDYVMDIGMHEVTGEPLLIELNPLSNAGLYSCDPGVLLDSLVAARKREINFDESPSYEVDLERVTGLVAQQQKATGLLKRAASSIKLVRNVR